MTHSRQNAVSGGKADGPRLGFLRVFLSLLPEHMLPASPQSPPVTENRGLRAAAQPRTVYCKMSFWGPPGSR